MNSQLLENNRIVAVLLIAVFSAANLQAQTKAERKAVAYLQVDQLKNGALLARLQTRELAINALRKTGKEAEANEIEKLQKAINKDILKAFRLNFKFAPVYFFTAITLRRLRLEKQIRSCF